MDSRPLASRLREEAPWNTRNHPAKNTFHHLIALFSTVAGKAVAASFCGQFFSNEINHLEHILKQFQLQNTQQKQALTARCECDA
ncbi:MULTISPECIES: hypothetical protein [Hydrogenophaga]|jgi:hypothetical protein|uniref:hypothetical protein n=1 Tax=Hydrogenophaga TaxID=47420 RepID=UPI0013E3F5F4|nr:MULTISPECIES: hypothetical protein [Hydrogenophaga]